jgi:hypothetical protein
MTPRSRQFAIGTLVSSLLVPGILVATAPFGEARSELGIAWGWGLALLVIVPSYIAMTRVISSGDDRRIHARFMYSMMGRFAAAMLGVTLFATQVEKPPLYVFVLAFFLGFAVLTALELTLLLSKSPDRNHA